MRDNADRGSGPAAVCGLARSVGDQRKNTEMKEDRTGQRRQGAAGADPGGFGGYETKINQEAFSEGQVLMEIGMGRAPSVGYHSLCRFCSTVSGACTCLSGEKNTGEHGDR